MTLSKLANHKGHNASSDVIDKLYDYFGCPIQDLVEHIPNPKKNTWITFEQVRLFLQIGDLGKVCIIYSVL